MARKPDKPGTWRVLTRGNGSFVMSGVDQTGRRVKARFDNFVDANDAGRIIFGAERSIGPIPNHQSKPVVGGVVDPANAELEGGSPLSNDWGLPIRTSPKLASAVAANLGVVPPVAGQTTPSPVALKAVADIKAADDKKAKQAKQANSLMEVVGIGYTAGIVGLSRRALAAADKVPCNPSPKQVNDLADATKETLTEWFGDREIKPWQMMFLLSIGIPAAMWIQSPKRKVGDTPNLRAV